MTVPAEEGEANYVPAAAVTRRHQALSGFIGRKELVGGSVSREVKSLGSTQNRFRYCGDWSPVGERGIPGVAVKCADIRRNTNSEGSALGRY